jgi:hypothetical protein
MIASSDARIHWSIAFLVHDARSGSTLLSDMLTRRLSGVYVTPEIAFVRLLRVAGRRSATAPRRGLAQRMVSGNLLRNLGIDAAELSGIVAGLPDPLPTSTLIRRLLETHRLRAGASPPDCVVVKHGIHVQVWREIAAAFGDATRFIHIHRDPRAVVSSKLRTVRPYVQEETLAWYGPLLGAWRWRAYSVAMREAAASGVPVLDVPYEALLEDPDDQLGRVAAFLGVAVRGRDERPAADYRIPEAERGIHGLVRSGRVHRDRADAWSTELSMRELKAVEAIASGEMRARGYRPSLDMSAARRALVIAAEIPRTARALVARGFRQLVRRGNGGAHSDEAHRS